MLPFSISNFWSRGTCSLKKKNSLSPGPYTSYVDISAYKNKATRTTGTKTAMISQQCMGKLSLYIFWHVVVLRHKFVGIFWKGKKWNDRNCPRTFSLVDLHSVCKCVWLKLRRCETFKVLWLGTILCSEDVSLVMDCIAWQFLTPDIVWRFLVTRHELFICLLHVGSVFFLGCRGRPWSVFSWKCVVFVHFAEMNPGSFTDAFFQPSFLLTKTWQPSETNEFPFFCSHALW